MITVISSGVPAMRKRTNRLEELLTHDAWSRDQLLTYQRAQLRTILEHAVSSSPYYRKVLGCDALDPDLRLEDLPTLPKATLMEQFDGVVADRRLRLADLEAHATGPDPGALFAREFHLLLRPPWLPGDQDRTAGEIRGCQRTMSGRPRQMPMTADREDLMATDTSHPAVQPSGR